MIYQRCTMTVQQVCKQTGLTVDTIRFYERSGLIAVEKGEYYKKYSQETIDTLLAIKKLRLAGLSLDEIKWLLSIDADPLDLSAEQFNAVYSVIDNAIDRAKIRAKEIAESQKLLENMKNKLITVRHENS